jgi:hypothetical protein
LRKPGDRCAARASVSAAPIPAPPLNSASAAWRAAT